MADDPTEPGKPTGHEVGKAGSVSERSREPEAEQAGFDLVSQGPKCQTCGDTRVVSRLRFPEAKPAAGYHDTMGECPDCQTTEAPR
jgi:hypothetical protein